MNKKQKALLRRYFFTVYIITVIGLVWQILEILEYGHTEPSTADTIITLIFIPFVYIGVCVIENMAAGYENEKKANHDRTLDAAGKTYGLRRRKFLWLTEKDANYAVRLMMQITQIQMELAAKRMKKSGDDGSASEDD